MCNNKYFLFFITLFFISACTQEDNLSVSTETAVVQAYLYAGQPVDSVFITKSYSYTGEDTTLVTLDNLEVEVTDGTAIFPLYYTSDGTYHNTAFIPQNGTSYTLSFEYNGELISSETYIPEKKEVSISHTSIELEKIELSSGFPGAGGFQNTEDELVEVSWENETGDYYYVVTENIEEDPEYVNDRLAEFDELGIAPRFFRITQPEISDFQPIDARRELTQYGTYRIIVFRVNPEYAALYETSGSSSVSITPPPTNINNGLGIFTGVSSDTVYLEVIKI